MRKYWMIWLLICGLPILSDAQQSKIDSITAKLNQPATDTMQMLRLGSLAYEYAELNPDSALHYSKKMLQLADKTGLVLEQSFALSEMGYALINLGNFPRSLESLLKSIELTEQNPPPEKVLPARFGVIDIYTDRNVSIDAQRSTKQARAYQYLGILYSNAGNYTKSIQYYQAALKGSLEAGNSRLASITYTTMARPFLAAQKADSAFWVIGKAEEFAQKSGFFKYMGSIRLNRGRVLQAMNRKEEAQAAFREAVVLSQQFGYFRGVVASNLALAAIHQQMGAGDSVLYFIHQGLQVAAQLKAPDLDLRLYKALAAHYQSERQHDSLVKYQALIIDLNEHLFNAKQAQDFQNIDFNDQQRREDIEAAQRAYRDSVRTSLLAGGLGIFCLIVLLLWRNNRHRVKANQQLQVQKANLEKALEQLKATQAQLIQSEKMASLGELTAGIAHEIQNPLNFVNNFSELNHELIEEMQEEMNQGNFSAAGQIASDIRSNLEKINDHGKRADSIVKGMLQHSRTSSGTKEVTDIPVLIDEYLRLAFHGFRSRDKSFNVNLVTDIDPAVGKFSVIPQELGRVMLNLVNNAFYAVDKKAATAPSGYAPTVTVRARQHAHGLVLEVEDNGAGIPASVRDKIFQPFFTTKPTGQGTGLGLSLSYDIITKGHGGHLSIRDIADGGACFVIELPG